MPKKCLLLKFKCQQFCIYTTSIFKLKNLINDLVLLCPSYHLTAKKCRGWFGLESSVFIHRRQSTSLLQSLILSDTSAVILANWWLCLENFSIIKWQYERYLNAEIRPYFYFYYWSCCNFFASRMAMWFCSLIPMALRTSFVYPCNPLERHKQLYFTHAVDRPNIVMLN